MKFGVLYTVDVPWETSIRGFMPTQRKLFRQTEGDEQYDYSHMEGRWAKGKHRKLVGVLNKKQFERFLDETGLFPEGHGTGGSLGVPWADPPGLGIAPAISFANDDPDSIQSAYVTPLPEVEIQTGFNLGNRADRYWRLIKRAILNKYGYDKMPLFITGSAVKNRPIQYRDDDELRMDAQDMLEEMKLSRGEED